MKRCLFLVLFANSLLLPAMQEFLIFGPGNEDFHIAKLQGIIAAYTNDKEIQQPINPWRQGAFSHGVEIGNRLRTEALAKHPCAFETYVPDFKQFKTAISEYEKEAVSSIPAFALIQKIRTMYATGIRFSELEYFIHQEALVSFEVSCAR